MYTTKTPRIIIHLDMDAFFASIEERDNPKLAGLPVVIGSDPKNGYGRGVVSTANYKARSYGIHSALPITKAWRLSEQMHRMKKGERAIFLPVAFKKYVRVSRSIRVILKSFSFPIEVTSIDEAYIDASFLGSWNKALALAQKIKETILTQERLSSSAGIGPNKLIAKIASGFKKPNGLSMVLPEEVETFLAPLSVRELPGVGPKTEIFLNKKNINRVADIRKFWKSDFQNWLGKWGKEIYQKSWGIDDRPLETNWQRKSLGHQETLPFDTLKISLLIRKLRELTQETVGALQKEKLRCRTVEVTVRFANFETKNRSKSFSHYTNDYTSIWEHALHLFLPFLNEIANPEYRMIRLVGISCSNLKKLTE